MFEKGNSYYADWRDRSGKRKRKSFETAEQAEAYEQAQKVVASPKQGRRVESRQQRPSNATSLQTNAARTHNGRQDDSRNSAVRSTRRKSESGTSTRSTAKSSPAHRHSQGRAEPPRSGGSSGTLSRSIGQKTSRLSSASRRSLGPAT